MFSYLRKTKVKVALIAITLYICITSTTVAFSQTPTQLPNRITIGVRTNIPVIGKYNKDTKTVEESFCYTFGQQLERELSQINVGIIVDFDDVNNEGKGGEFPRFQGLRNGSHDIQCGSNSISPRPGVIFSNPFYETGIKLMIKKEDFNQYLKKISGNNRIDLVKNEFKIAAEENTTTYRNLKNQGFNIQRYPSKDAALNAVISQPRIAFADDAIILRSYLKEGYPGEIDFNQNDYIIFPERSRDYVIETPEKYGIAISDTGEKSKYSQELKNTINRVLETPSLEQERAKLQNYEDGAKFSQSSPARTPVLLFAIGFSAVAIILTLVAYRIK